MQARKLTTALVVLGAFIVTAAAAPIAGAQSATKYAPDTNSRTFATDVGGWTGSTEYTNGLCIAGVTCPAVTQEYVGTGGTGGAGDGFIRSNLSGLASLLSTTRATWQSPAFTYTGAAGNPAEAVTFGLSRQTNAAALLTLLGTADYSVILDDLTVPGSVTIVDQAPITNLAGWTADASRSVDPGQLTIGRQYRIRIVTEMDLPVAVIPSATFDYDDVVLEARSSAGGGQPPLTGGELDDALKGAVAGVASLKGNTIHVTVKCPKRAPAKCVAKLVGKAKGKKSKSATKTGKVTVKPGKKKVAKLKVKPRFLAKVKRMKKMVFKVQIKSGPRKVSYFRKLKLKRR
jgi:hypothetical protein